jgi:endonuclease YncB( thermonuclease family)
MPVQGTAWRVRYRDLTVVAALLAAAALGCTPISTGDQAGVDSEQRRLTSVPPASGGAPGMFAPTGPTERGLVVRITDGDTVRVVIDGVEHRLRYIGIDTPESVAPNTPVEPYAKAATEANARLVDGERVVLERDVSETDRFDRLLRYVWLAPDLENRSSDDDVWRLVNLELVRAGLAEAVDYPPDTKYSGILGVAETEARAAGRGMWADA